MGLDIGTTKVAMSCDLICIKRPQTSLKNFSGGDFSMRFRGYHPSLWQEMIDALLKHLGNLNSVNLGRGNRGSFYTTWRNKFLKVC